MNVEKKKSFLKKLYDWSGSWTGTVVIVFTIIFFIAQAFVIPSGSMKSTLLIGDMLFVKKFSYGIATPTIPWIELKVLPDFDGDGHLFQGSRPVRGDIVVFRNPRDEKIHFVKRCVATGGDTILLKDKHLFLRPKGGNKEVEKKYKKSQIATDNDGKMWIMDPFKSIYSGIQWDESVTKETSMHDKLFDMNPITIPEDEFFMMGDNRDHSNDSRFWGMVKYKHIVGKPWFVYFSWDSDKKIRWDRVFRSVDYLQMNVKKNDDHKDGIY